MRKQLTYLTFLAALLLADLNCLAQTEPTRPERSTFEEPITLFWLNTYGNIRVTNRLFWVAQTHFRLQEDKDTKFVGQWAQVYNRHAISYLFSKKFNASLGGVLRVNFNTKKEELEKNTVPEWRIWHQYQFAMPLSRLMVYHRIRVEHRWTKGFTEGDSYEFRNRWRYMFKLKMPLNKPELGSGTIYLSPEAEIIMQSGKTVIDSPMEDLRLHTSVGYIINPRLTVATGFMYSQGQELANGAFYKQKYTMRFHVYFAPDLRRVKNKLPAIHMDE